MSDLGPDAARGPSRPEKLTVDFYEQSDALAIHKKRGGGPVVFLSLWLIGWTVGCVALLGAVIHAPAIGMFAFALPFWASWLFVAGVLAWSVFGKDTLLLRRDEAIFLRTALVKLSSRAVPRKEIQGFRECRSSHTENDEYLWGIEMVTLGKPVRFAFRLPDRERAWLIHQLNRFLETTDPRAPGDGLEIAETSDRPALAREDTCSAADGEPLTLERTFVDPPTDCDWRMVDDVGAFAYWQRGSLHLGTLAMLLFLNLFWNGIVSVFILSLFGLMPGGDAPQGGEWWGLFVFLIPFEAIGLGMFAGLVHALLEPSRHTLWRFEQSRIVRQTRWPIYSRTRAWDVLHLDRLELRQHGCNGARRQQFLDIAGAAAAQAPFELAFVTLDNADLCEIDNLTEGEARWMARGVLERRPKWFGGLAGASRASF